jgi:hypothetical protein
VPSGAQLTHRPPLSAPAPPRPPAPTAGRADTDAAGSPRQTGGRARHPPPPDQPPLRALLQPEFPDLQPTVALGNFPDIGRAVSSPMAPPPKPHRRLHLRWVPLDRPQVAPPFSTPFRTTGWVIHPASRVTIRPSREIGSRRARAASVGSGPRPPSDPGPAPPGDPRRPPPSRALPPSRWLPAEPSHPGKCLPHLQPSANRSTPPATKTNRNGKAESETFPGRGSGGEETAGAGSADRNAPGPTAPCPAAKLDRSGRLRGARPAQTGGKIGGRAGLGVRDPGQHIQPAPRHGLTSSRPSTQQ